MSNSKDWLIGYLIGALEGVGLALAVPIDVYQRERILHTIAQVAATAKTQAEQLTNKRVDFDG